MIGAKTEEHAPRTPTVQIDKHRGRPKVRGAAKPPEIIKLIETTAPGWGQRYFEALATRLSCLQCLGLKRAGESTKAEVYTRTRVAGLQIAGSIGLATSDKYGSMVAFVKTILEILDTIFRRAKSVAAERGIPLWALISEAVADKLRAENDTSKPG